MDPIPTLHEVARVLVPGGILGVLWSGPDPEGSFLVNARELLGSRSPAAAGEGKERDSLGEEDFATLIQGDGVRPATTLEIPRAFLSMSPNTRSCPGMSLLTQTTSSACWARSAGSFSCPKVRAGV